VLQRFFFLKRLHEDKMLMAARISNPIPNRRNFIAIIRVTNVWGTWIQTPQIPKNFISYPKNDKFDQRSFVMNFLLKHFSKELFTFKFAVLVGKIYRHIGKYVLMMRQVFSKPERLSIYRKRIIEEIDKIGVQSVGIIALLSAFMGAVITLQTAANIDSAWVPKWTIGYTTRQSLILEFSSTIMSLILSGKVGSNIASEIGTMRITEQIDALDIMGVNSASYLILPKVVAAILIFPFLVVISMFLGIAAGAIIGPGSGGNVAE
jgi:hypothetical protein